MQKLVIFYQFVIKTLSGNEILTITQGHNCVVCLRKLTRNNPTVDLIMVNAYAKFDQIPSIHSKYILSGNKILRITMGHHLAKIDV